MTGASVGLGARFTQVLHQADATVLATARRADRLEALAKNCGEGVEFLAGDITDARYRQEFVEHLASAGGLDILVNNAGVCDGSPISEQPLDELVHVVEVHLVSVLELCRLTAPLLLAAAAPSVINVASMYGIVASHRPMAAYNATKGSIVNLTRQLAVQWGEKGVRVNALAPGFFPTEMTGFLSDSGSVDFISEHTLLGRTPTLEELDGPLLFLASDASSYMTGQVVIIDGGWTAI